MAVLDRFRVRLWGSNRVIKHVRMNAAQARREGCGLLRHAQHAIRMTQHVTAHRHIDCARCGSDDRRGGSDKTGTVLRVNDRNARLVCGTHPHETHGEKASVHADDIDVVLAEEARDRAGCAQGREADDVRDREVASVGTNIDALFLSMPRLIRDSQHVHVMPQLCQGHRQVVDVRL